MKKTMSLLLVLAMVLSLFAGCSFTPEEIGATYKSAMDSATAKYVPISEAGTYNREIITDEILNAPSDLPEVTQSVLPSEWKGSGMGQKKQFAEEYSDFEESDVAFLHENGFNFTRLFLNFQTFRYPNYMADPYTVNQKELEELDQLLAWCMEYGVHLQITMNGYMDENGNYEQSEVRPMPESDAAWALTRAYWVMLAERYADIPSKYLSFDLANESDPQPDEIEKQKAKLAEMVGEMRAADPDRVLLYSQTKGNLDWTEAFASLGLGVAAHPYAPLLITVGDHEYMKLNPYVDVIWPLPYFPTGNVMGGQTSLEISGDIAGANMGIHIWYSEADPVLGIYADGQLLEKIYPEGVLNERGEYNYYDTLYSVQIPDNAETVSLRVEEGFARIDTVIFEKNGIRTTMMPSDTLEFPDNTDPQPLIVNGDGTYTNSENLVYDQELIYQQVVEPYQKVAQQYGVGFMVNEFGIFGWIEWDIDLVTAFHRTYLEMLEERKIPWCYCETANDGRHLVIRDSAVKQAAESQWIGATEEDISYTLRDGSEVTLKVCKELLDTFTKYTLK